MKLKDIARQLANRINQPAAIEVFLRQVYAKGFIDGTKQSPWIIVKERKPDDNENIIVMCKHGAIFNCIYCNGVWFCMDGYINDTFKGTPVYSSMSSVPPLWEAVAWMPIPKFNDSGCSVFPNNLQT